MTGNLIYKSISKFSLLFSVKPHHRCNSFTSATTTSAQIGNGLYLKQEDPDNLLSLIKWNIVCAVCIERMPQISREIAQVESRFNKFMLRKEIGNTRMNDFEFDHYNLEQELAQTRTLVEKGKLTDRHLTDIRSKQADTEEMLHSLKEEYESWTPSPRCTYADEILDVKSLQRCLAKPLYLLVRKSRKEHAWQFSQQPTSIQTESLRESAFTQLSENFGANLVTNVYSTMPQAFLSYYQSAEGQGQDREKIGSKVFIMKSVYVSGDIQLSSAKLVDYAWLTKSEIKNYVSKEYFKAIEPLLFE